MPIIINNSTGLAENLDQDVAQSSLSSGSHSIPMIDPQGQHVSIPYAQAQDALSQGYRQPNPVELKNLQDYATYSSPEQQLATALEGAASSLTLGTSTGAEIGMGVSPESIRKRREVNPGMHEIGQAGGLLGGMLTGAGEAQAMQLAGEGAAALSGISGATLAGRAALTGIKQAAEMALFQAGDEVSKAFTQDPNQSVESAIIDTGLSAVSGAALGAGGHYVLGGLWNATVGPKLEKILQSSKMESGGIPAITDIAQKAEKAGIELDPVMSGALTPEGRETFRELRMLEGTRAGKAVNESLDNVRKQAENQILSVFGKTKDNLEKSSIAELGDKLRTSIVDSIEPLAKSANEAYEKLNTIDKSIDLNPTSKAAIIRSLSEFTTQNAFALSGADESSILNTLTKRLESAKNIDNVKTALNEAVAKSKSTEISGTIKGLREAMEEGVYDTALLGQSEKIVEATRKARQLYSTAKSDLGELGDVIGLDIRKMSPKMFVELLKNPAEISSESLINKFGNVKNTALIDYLQKTFPNAVDIVKEFHQNRIPLKELKSGDLDVNAIFRSLADTNKLPKEVRDFAFTPEQLEKLNSIKEVLGAIPPKMGPSGTPEGMRVILRNLFTALGGVTGYATGRTLTGLLVGKGVQYLSEEVPQALRLSYLKMLGGNEGISAPGFNAMFKAVRASIKGTEKLNKSVANLFKSGVPVLEASSFPTAKSLNLLHSSMLATQEDPTRIETAQGNLSHYLPNHSIALSSTMARAAGYLSTLQPDKGKPGLLDKPRQPSNIEKARYNRALEIVQQPLMILEHVKNGTITPEDMQTFSTVYPSLTNVFRQKIINQMTDHIAKGKEIPYKTRLGLSLFLGQPLESSAAPQNIMSNQMLFAPPAPPAPAGPARPSGGFKASFSKLSNIYATPGQLRERQKSNR